VARAVVTFENAVGGLVALAVLIYPLRALLEPERF
jgi:hypothetical protein